MRSLKTSLWVFLSLAGALANPVLPRQEQARTLIDPALFPEIQRYTRFSVASLATFIFGSRKCPDPPFGAPVVSLIENIVTDTQAAVFQDDKAKEFILSFVGSSSVQDFITDFTFIPVDFKYGNIKCTGCKAHLGFYGAWKSVANQTVQTLEGLTAKHPDYEIVVTGHSLGGALAALAYPSLKSTTLPIRAAFTFGEPRVGNQAFADYVERVSGATDSNIGNYFRVTHHTDGVPNLPNESQGFRHSRTEFYQLDDASKNQTAQTTYRCYGQESMDCNRGASSGFINQDHLVYSGIEMTNGKQCGLGGGI